MAETEENSFTFESCIRGYHVYKDAWEAKINEEVTARIEEDNKHDKNAVAFLKNSEIVGHVPLEYSKVCKFFIKRGGTLKAKVIGKHENNNVGLEIPAQYIFTGSKKDTIILSKMLTKIKNL